MISSESDEHPVEALAAEFMERHRLGEAPDIEEYAAKHPDLATEIRDLFPTIEALEKVRAQHDESADGHLPFQAQKLTRLGDLRILREIGRGGMGIVYEAVQESLRRRVAVKVLARHSRLDDTHRRRFLREARTAGRLHHTNIVPILGVGEQDGFDFYVMQYIDGIGLDAVLAKLRTTDVETPESVRLSAYWRLPDPNDTGSDSRANAHQSIRDLEFDSASAPHNTGLPQSEMQSLEPTGAGSQPLRLRCQTYWQDVALVGLQVAQALEYAHSQGTLHRDIKPANLLVDDHGTVWVADFGLAKGIEQEAVSRTGEVLGTLQYMAPEQWHGVADNRSDLYSLAVTLYELLTWRSPRGIHDGLTSLGKAALQTAIPMPRKVFPAIPADLETIVMKAMAEEPEQRYQTAGELAGDLICFLKDHPISVRQPGVWERWIRWRRRNPAAAVLSTVAAALAVLVIAVVSVGYIQTRAALKRESQALESVTDQRQRAETMLRTSLKTLDDVFQRLVPIRIGEARARAIPGDESGGMVDATQPMVSPETAALLKDLLDVYDKLAQAEGTKELSVESARANRRVGDIYARLGNVDQAAIAYQHSLEKYQRLAAGEPQGESQLEIARLHNDLGSIDSRSRDPDLARQEHRKALSLLKTRSLPAPSRPASPQERFELARTYYFLGRGPDRQANPGTLSDKPGPPPPNGRLPPRNRRPPGRRAPEGGPGPRMESEPEKLQQAIAILEQLIRGEPKNPAYLYLLAQCYREDSGYRDDSDRRSAPLPEIDKEARLLAELVKDHPGVADYQFELADTYAMLDIRELRPEELSRAEERLRLALAQSSALVDRNPYVSDYVSLHIHILHKLALVLRESPPKGQQARLDEAAQCYQEAIRKQRALVERFPENVSYHFWLAKIQTSAADLWLERRNPQEAAKILEMAVKETEQFYLAHQDAQPLDRVLHELCNLFGDTLSILDEDQPAKEAYVKAEKYRPPRPQPGRRRPHEETRPRPSPPDGR